MAGDRVIATYTIYCEASGEDHAARLGVAYSEVNRFRTGRFGATLAEVCLRRAQYSEWNGDKVDNANLLRAARCPDSDAVMLDCGQAFDEALLGRAPDPTRGATHYHDVSMADDPPSWTVGAIRTATLGRLIFYRGVK
jgi:N-acetylmuramoyl-L-alanine amidase